MHHFIVLILTVLIYSKCYAEKPIIFETDVNFRVEPGSRTCVFERAKAGQVMEVFYQVLDGQHGDLDISFDVIAPNSAKLVTDYKKSQNSIIMDLELDGDYAFCLDNTYSVMNSKLVFLYILIEDKDKMEESDAEVAVVDEEGGEKKEEEVLEWSGVDENGEQYFIEVTAIIESISRTLSQVLKARHLLDIYSATKSRDSYMAIEDTFIVDVWSGLQITLMFVVGMLQVYTIKKLFNRPSDGYKSMF